MIRSAYKREVIALWPNPIVSLSKQNTHYCKSIVKHFATALLNGMPTGRLKSSYVHQCLKGCPPDQVNLGQGQKKGKRWNRAGEWQWS